MAAIDISEAENNRTIAAKQGDLVAVHLDENPMTGYQWTVQVEPPDAWRVVSSSFSPATAGRAGAGGTRTWLPQAVGPGKARLVFDLRRGWTTDHAVKHLEFELLAK